MQRVSVALMSLLWAVSAKARTPQPAPHPGTRPVEINVIVRNHDGSPLTGLRKEDFQVFDNGEPQPISEFSAQSRPGLQTQASATIVLLDDLNTGNNFPPDARQQITKYLQQMRPGDGIATYELADGLHVPESDRKGCASCGWRFIPFDNMRRGPSEFYGDEVIKATFRAIGYIVNNLAALPGRKNLIWISSVFPEHVGTVERLWTKDLLFSLNNVNVAIYPVSATRLPSKRHEGPEALAGLTGGRAFMDPAAIEIALDTAIQDSSFTYRLVFYPRQQKSDNSIHSLQVTLTGSPAAELHYRTGYLDFPSDDAKLSAAALSDSVWSPLEANGIGLRAQAHWTSAGIEVALRIDPHSVFVRRSGDHWEGQLDLLFAQIDGQGKQTASVGDTLPISLDQAAYEKVKREGVLYGRNIAHAPQTAALRLIVRDPATGALGSLTVPLSDQPQRAISGTE